MKKLLLALFALCSIALSTIAQELYEIPSGQSTRWISFENRTGAKGAGGKENKGAKGHPADILQPGSTTTMLDYKGAGIVQRIWLTVNERSPVMLRSVRIEMYWDNTSTPAVSAPLGDFFGMGLGRRIAFDSEFFSDPEGRSFNVSIPMPFKTAAKILIINESKKPVTLFYDVNLMSVAKYEKPINYFHAYWNRENKTKLGQDFQILPQVNGRGRFLGTNVGVKADTIYETSWWGEGEVKMYIDGDKDLPTLIGTGTEDYIGTAWGQGQYFNRYQGAPINDEKNREFCFYRYHVRDPVYFQNSCRVTIQQMGGEGTDFVRRLHKKGAKLIPVSVAGDKLYKLFDMENAPDLHDAGFPQGWTNYYREDDVSATAYFYLDKPTNGLPKIADVASRTAGLKD